MSPTLPVSRYVCGEDMPAAPLPDETPACEPLPLDVPPAGGCPAGAPALPVLPLLPVLPVLPVDDGDPVPLPVREPPPLDEPDIDEVLLDTFVRMNSAPAPPAAVRDDEPDAVDPAVDPVDSTAPPD
jgi:hypothetical protein